MFEGIDVDAMLPFQVSAAALFHLSLPAGTMMHMDEKYTAAAEASSTHPHDWGRAMAVAITGLVRQAIEGGDEVGHENLYDEDLHMRIHGVGDGVRITLSWTPKK